MNRTAEKDVKQSSKRNTQSPYKSADHKVYGSKCVGREQMEEIVERLCQIRTRVPDHKRTGAGTEMGIQNSYLWKGFN